MTRVHHRTIDIDGTDVFYRETDGAPGAPTLLLLHGFPSSSHQYARLIDRLGDRFRIVAPDYPGFGRTDAPAGFTATFDALADTVERFLGSLGLTRFHMYVFDYGAPVGFRIAERHPDWIAGLVVQNGNAYEDGLSDDARAFIARRPDRPGDAEAVLASFGERDIRWQYESGTRDPQNVAPEGWTLDHHYMELPGRREIQLALQFDYHTNVERYPVWQAWLREHRPPTLIVWGGNDPFFTVPGALAYVRDLPDARLHVFDTGHFALEEDIDIIAPLVAEHLDRSKVATR